MHPLYDHSPPPSNKSGTQTERPSVYVDIIAGRDGQKLYGCLCDLIRDLDLHGNRGPYRLTVSLSKNEVPYALDDSGNAQRLRVTFIAKVVLRDKNNAVVLDCPISASITRNIASISGDILMSMYGSTNDSVIKELAFRIIENVKISLTKAGCY